MYNDNLYLCTKCRAKTDWDFDLGTRVLCLPCWDQEISELDHRPTSERKRVYMIQRRERLRRTLNEILSG